MGTPGVAHSLVNQEHLDSGAAAPAARSLEEAGGDEAPEHFRRQMAVEEGMPAPAAKAKAKAKAKPKVVVRGAPVLGDEEAPPQEDEQQGLKARGKPIPETPSQAEIDAHELTHIPPRSWCRVCIGAKRIGDQHRTLAATDGIPTVGFDQADLIDRRTGRHEDQL